MEQTLSDKDKQQIFHKLSVANKAFQKIYPGDRLERQPIHTVYGGAHIFKHDLVEKMGAVAKSSLQTYASDFSTLARLLELEGYQTLPTIEKPELFQSLVEKMDQVEWKNHPAWLAYSVYQKVLNKLDNEPVEDFRIDFEDGFGNRADSEEDQVAEQAAKETAEGMRLECLPPFLGIRIKPFTEDFKDRGVRTLDIYLSTLLGITGGRLPHNFVVMLPKVTIPEQIAALCQIFELLETRHHLPSGSLKMEMMVETTQSVMNDQGRNSLMQLVQTSEGRCIACHFGTYDYTASSNITAKYQDMGHQVCDFAHHMTKVALGGTGIWLSDGATNVMPIGPHRGTELTSKQQEENQQVVHAAWKKGYDHIRHSLYKGLYQGWDLHPAQLPMRYTAVYAFFLESFHAAAVRLQKFLKSSARATLTGDVFDDAATGQGLLNYFIKAVNCGALTEAEVQASTGLTADELHLRSFNRILDSWQQRNS